MVKNQPAGTGDVRGVGSAPGSGRVSGGGHGNSLQYSCMENPVDGGAWWAAVHKWHAELDMTEVTQHTNTTLLYILFVYICYVKIFKYTQK